MEEVTIYKNPASYSAFPDIKRLPNRELVVVFREAIRRRKITHLDSTSKAVLARSRDSGRTWHYAGVVYDDEYGIQDPSVAVLRDGSLICNFFKWKVVKEEPFDHGVEGMFVVRSHDGGHTWEKEAQKVDVPELALAATSDATLELPDGRLLVPIYGSRAGERQRAIVVVSEDKGNTWSRWSTVAFDPLGNMDFQEPALAYHPSGKILCMMRVAGGEPYLWYSESLDGGITWTTPRRTPVWGFPAHLLVLRDGRVLCSYGYRRPPYGVHACLSYDVGKTWDLKNEIIIRNDGLDGDLGYPSSVELEDGQVLTVYYFHDPDGVRFIAGSIYRV